MVSREKLSFILLYLIVIILSILYLGRILLADERIFLQINNIYGPSWDTLFLIITYAGSVFFWIFITLIIWLKKQRKVATYMICALIIDTVFMAILKWTFLRPRPFETHSSIKVLDIENGPSFPSGHSARAFSAAIVIGSFYTKARIPLFILAILVALSRIYVGVHYPLDVIYGAFNGVLVGILCLSLPIKGLEKKLTSSWNKIIKKIKILKKIEDSF